MNSSLDDTTNDATFAESILSIMWPKTAAGAGSFWNYDVSDVSDASDVSERSETCPFLGFISMRVEFVAAFVSRELVRFNPEAMFSSLTIRALREWFISLGKTSISSCTLFCCKPT